MSEFKFDVMFRDVGRERVSFSVQMNSVNWKTLTKAVRKHLMSTPDFWIDEDAKCGYVLAGVRAVGEFAWTETAVRQAGGA